MIPYHIRKEAEEGGCSGLIDGFARNLNSYELFSAESCTSEDGPFFCTSCLSDAVVRKCAGKRDHFAHIARHSPVPGTGERELHFKCKNEICDILSSFHPKGKWETERSIPANIKKGTPALRPDISGYIDGKLVAIEVQASALTISKVWQRTKNYTKWSINLLWIVPLTDPLGSLPFRPRLYEKYLHSMYYGRVYYWTAGQGIELNPVHFGIAGRDLEYREWTEDGEVKSAGGYYKPYKTIKTPIYGTIVNISSQFISSYRDEFVPDNVRKAVPKCFLWKDTLPIWWNAEEEDKYTEEYFEEIYSDIRKPNIVLNKYPHQHKPDHHHFNSDLEAKWAIFFEAMGIEYEYEKEAFQLEGTSYLPSFWLPQVSMWAEVSPNKFSRAGEQKCQLLANATNKRCLLLEGPPDLRSYWGLAPYRDEDDYPYDTDYILYSDYLTSESRFFSDTGHSREEPATDKDYGFWDDYISAVDEATRHFDTR